MSPAEQQNEQKRLEQIQAICDLFGRDHDGMRKALEQAGSELDREMGVRERCFKQWIEQGKISRIDAKDRWERMLLAQQMVNFMLDIVGRTPVTTGADDDIPF
jgi:hypothetical protein